MLRLRQRELVKMVVLPAHRVLNRHVQIPKGIAGWHLNSAPDDRICAGKNDEKLVYERSARQPPGSFRLKWGNPTRHRRLTPSNGLRLSGRPRVQLGHEEPFGGRSAPTAG